MIINEYKIEIKTLGTKLNFYCGLKNINIKNKLLVPLVLIVHLVAIGKHQCHTLCVLCLKPRICV